MTIDRNKYDSREKKSIVQRVIIFSSFVFSPYIIFVFTTNTLFLTNQRELNYDTRVYIPFVLVALLVSGAAACLYSYCSRTRHKRIFSFIFWAYYLIGVGYMIYGSQAKYHFIDMRKELFLAVLFCVFLIILLLLIRSNTSLKEHQAFFSLLLVVFLLCDVYSFSTQYDFQRMGSNRFIGEVPLVTPHPISETAENKINIYHILFDSFQTDLFQGILTPELEKKLGGFIYYPKNTSMFRFSNMSVPSVFAGKLPDYNNSQAEYRRQSIEKGLELWLKNDGYETFCFETAKSGYVYSFDHNIHFQDYTYGENDQFFHTFSVFSKLWARIFFIVKSVDVLSHENRIINSYNGFMHAQQIEKDLPGSNRYSFYHLWFPHDPFLIRSDGSFKRRSTLRGGSSPIFVREQVVGTVKILNDFLENLKKLGRYDDSLIIVHADHGMRVRSLFPGQLPIRQEDEELDDWLRTNYGRRLNIERAQSRALLLIKPPGNTINDKFQTSDVPSSLIDIAPTVMDYVDIDIPGDVDGESLLDYNSEMDRERYYHTLKVQTKNFLWTDQYVRFRIDDDGYFILDKVIKLENNPREPERK